MRILRLTVFLAYSFVCWPASPEVAFSPNNGATDLVVKTIESATVSIYVAAYSFTSAPIAQALVSAAKRGVDVRVVVDKGQATAKYSSVTFLVNNKIPTRVDYKYAIMHDKFMVIDSETVELGSFNYTTAAEKHNAENVLVLHDATVAKRYATEWSRLWAESVVAKARQANIPKKAHVNMEDARDKVLAACMKFGIN